MAVEEKNKRTLLLEEQRQSELLDALKGISGVISNLNNNDVVSKAIGENTKEIGNFGKALGQLKVNVEAPNINVQTNQESVINEIKLLREQGERIESLLALQNKYFEEIIKPKDYEFEFTRNNYGALQSPIKAKVKTNKSKYQA